MAAENALLKFEPGLMIWTVVTFLVTFVALRLIAWKPLLGALDEREGRIRTSLEKAEQAQRDAEQAIASNQARMDKAMQRSQELVAEARQEAERVRARAREDAREEAQKIVDQGRRQLDSERRAVLAEIRMETATIAIHAAEHLLKKNLDQQEHQRLVREFIDQLPQNQQLQ
jgi:F-type H+-transporting ATPase subunit b